MICGQPFTLNNQEKGWPQACGIKKTVKTLKIYSSNTTRQLLKD
jgi:hypothetical protein